MSARSPAPNDLDRPGPSRGEPATARGGPRLAARSAAVVIGLALGAGPSRGLAEGDPPARGFDDVVEALPGGSVNWTELTLTVESRSDRRVGAWKDRRVQEQDALDSLGPTLDGLVRRVRVTSAATAGDLMALPGALGAGLIERSADWKITETRYMGDGGVEMSAVLDLRAWLAPALAELTAGPVPDLPPEGPTGLVIDARGLGFSPALVPTVRAQSGQEVLSAAALARVVGDRQPPIVYVADPADPRAAARAGDRPLLARAVSAEGASVTVPTSSPMVTDPAAPLLIAARKVVLVVDP